MSSFKEKAAKAKKLMPLAAELDEIIETAKRLLEKLGQSQAEQQFREACSAFNAEEITTETLPVLADAAEKHVQARAAESPERLSRSGGDVQHGT